MNGEDSILVGCFEDVAWVRVNGKGSYLNSHLVRDFAEHCLARGIHRFVIDLENCPAVDSTFIGILTGISLSIEEAEEGAEEGNGAGGIEVLNANERTTQSICKLGLDAMIEIDRDGSAWREERKLVEENISKPLTQPEIGIRERAEIMLEAHQALVSANEENRRRFCDVIEFLERDLESGVA